SAKLLICTVVFLAAAGEELWAQSPAVLDPNNREWSIPPGEEAQRLFRGGVEKVVVRRGINPATGTEEPIYRRVIRVSGTGQNPSNLAVTVLLGPEEWATPPIVVVDPPPPGRPPERATGPSFTVKVKWDTQVDIDLWVTEPGSTDKVFYQR